MSFKNNSQNAAFVAAIMSGSPAAAFAAANAQPVKRRMAGRRSLANGAPVPQPQKRHSSLGFFSLFRSKDRSPTASVNSDDDRATSGSSLSLSALPYPIYPPDREWVASPKVNEANCVNVALEQLWAEEFAQSLDFHELFNEWVPVLLSRNFAMRKREAALAHTRSCHNFGSRRSSLITSDSLKRGLSLPFDAIFSSSSSSSGESEDGDVRRRVERGEPHPPCPLHPHLSGKHCAVCKCPRDVHDVTHKESVNVQDRLGLNKEPEDPIPLAHHHNHHHNQATSAFEASSRAMPLNKAPRPTSSDVYSWIPAGLAPDRVEEFMSSWPKDKVPKRSSPGDRWREHQLAYQLPRQDLALAYCRYVEPQNHASYQDFVAARNDIALDIAYVKENATRNLKCYACSGNIPAGTFGVMAPKFGENVAWHPSCFQCTTCAELLVDLTYCVHEDQLYCERHYAEQLKPRCAACDELIFSGEYTKAMSKDWHLGHFSCWQCDESLTGQRYVLRDEHPYCVKCYESVFANTCDDCNRIIGIDSKDLSYKDRHWHEACFLCNKCRVSLVDKQFGSKADKIFCGPCYDSMYATRCDGCGEIFRAGTKKMEYKSRQWHEKCFCCCVCKTPIGTKSFIPREQDIYCSGCYEEKFATRCVKCSKIITTGGVTYKNDPWHRECFTCTHCDKSLAGQRFTSKDEKPYCAECFGELFAKRCTACTKPITGIGGTRFISFEDRHWHNDCFQCASCNVSLVGKGFITDGADILCPECAKQRVL